MNRMQIKRSDFSPREIFDLLIQDLYPAGVQVLRRVDPMYTIRERLCQFHTSLYNVSCAYGPDVVNRDMISCPCRERC